MTKNESTQEIFHLLDEAGIPVPYVRSLLPSWWDDEASANPAGLAEFKIMLSRNLGLDYPSLSSEEPELQFKLPHVRKLKRSIRYSEAELTPALSIALAAAKVAAATCPYEYRALPMADELREIIFSKKGVRYISHRALIRQCWQHGIPVIHISEFPKGMAKMDGLVCSIEGRPVIVLSKKTSFSSWMAFILAHEMGHIANGHCEDDEVIIDESFVESALDDENRDNDEKTADKYALSLIGSSQYPKNNISTDMQANEIMKKAMEIHRKYRIDAGHIILKFAYETGAWDKAISALKIIDTQLSAINDIKSAMMAELKIDSVSENSIRFLYKVCGFEVIEE